MARQYLRRVRLRVGAENGRTLDFSDLRVAFTITAATVQTPAAARIQVWNVSRETFQIMRAEFAEVQLLVGYGEPLEQLFRGNIRQARFVRVSPVDAYVEISAADGDRAYINAFVSASLAEGNTAADRIRVLDAAMAPLGVRPGWRPADYAAWGDRPSPRAVVLHGMARDFYRQEAQNLGFHWFIERGQLHFLPYGQAFPTGAVLLNAESGLIGWPEQTEFGISATCLLNPRIGIGTEVHINNHAINEQQVNLADAALNLPTGLGGGGQGGITAAPLVPITEDGRYVVINCTYRGDTHGGEGSPWYCEMMLQALGTPMTRAFVNQGALPQ